MTLFMHSEWRSKKASGDVWIIGHQKLRFVKIIVPLHVPCITFLTRETSTASDKGINMDQMSFACPTMPLSACTLSTEIPFAIRRPSWSAFPTPCTRKSLLDQAKPVRTVSSAIMHSFAISLLARKSPATHASAPSRTGMLTLPSRRHALLPQRTLVASFILGALHRLLVDTHPSMQETRFLDGASTLPTRDRGTRAHGAGMADRARVAVASVAVAVGRHGGGEVGDVFWEGVLRADGGDAALGGFAGFGEGVVAGVKVFAFL